MHALFQVNWYVAPFWVIKNASMRILKDATNFERNKKTNAKCSGINTTRKLRYLANKSLVKVLDCFETQS